MKLNPPTRSQPTQEPTKQDDLKKKLRLVRAGQGIAESLRHGNMEHALAKTIVSGIKLASENPFADPGVSPLKLAAEIRKLGLSALIWTPETIFSAIDKKYFGWSDEKAALALDRFHETGILQTDVPQLSRQKVYAIRIVATSDTPHNEWHVFEKVGAAFNDRVAHFGEVQKLSPGECARTLAIIESIRPDEYSSEIAAYIAASCHEDGFYTTAPSKYLKMADTRLDQFNYESSGLRATAETKGKISKRLAELRDAARTLSRAPEDPISLQALKILAADLMGDEALA